MDCKREYNEQIRDRLQILVIISNELKGTSADI